MMCVLLWAVWQAGEQKNTGPFSPCFLKKTVYFMQHLEKVEFKLGTLGRDLSLAKFKEKSIQLVNLFSSYDLFIFSLALNRVRWAGRSHAPALAAVRAGEWAPAQERSTGWDPKMLTSSLRASVPACGRLGKNNNFTYFYTWII